MCVDFFINFFFLTMIRVDCSTRDNQMNLRIYYAKILFLSFSPSISLSSRSHFHSFKFGLFSPSIRRSRRRRRRIRR